MSSEISSSGNPSSNASETVKPYQLTKRNRRRKRQGRPLNGVLILDKPQGLTSNAALQKVKSIFNASKAGHTGSLDPLATGVLPICFGEATKFSQFLLESDKAYFSTAILGVTTDTGDAEGRIIEERPVPEIDTAEIEAVLAKFRGRIEQIPSMYSAIKHNGTPLYELARQGIEVERKPRSVDINKLELTSLQQAELSVYVECSKGTYIRSLIEDIGQTLDCGAHVSVLRRSQAGPFSLDEATSMETLMALYEARDFEALNQLLLPMDSAVRDWPALAVSENVAFYLQQGHPVQVAEAPTQGWVKLNRKNDDFLGVGEILSDGRVAPRRLISQS